MKLEPNWVCSLPTVPLSKSFYLTKPLFINGHSYETFGDVLEANRGPKLEQEGFGYCFESLPRLLRGEISSEILQFANSVLMPPLDHRSPEWEELITQLVIPDSLEWFQAGPTVKLLNFKRKLPRWFNLRLLN